MKDNKRIQYWLASYPRSGNTFARLLLKKIFAFDTPSDSKLEAPLDCPLTRDLNENQNNRVVFTKTHENRFDNRPAIILVRDGRDALISHVHYQRMFWGWSEPFSVLLDRAIDPDDSFCSNWSNFYESWFNVDQAGCQLIYFDQLIEQPLTTMGTCLEKLGVSIDKTIQPAIRIPSFARLHAQNPKFFRRGRKEYWRKEMSDEQHRVFWKHHGFMMNELGYRNK